MSNHRSWWLIFTAGAIAVVAALGWMSVVVFQSEQAEATGQRSTSEVDGRVQLLHALMVAQVDDEQETEDERIAVARAHEDIGRGQLKALEDIKRELSL